MNAELLLSTRCPCSDSVREEFNAWISELFKTSNNESDVIQSFAAQKQNKQSTSFKEIDGASKKETMAELLEHLDSTFSLIKLPTGKESWIDKDEVIGLRKIGIHVPNPWVLHWIKDENEIIVDRSKPLPSMVAIALLPTHALIENGKYMSQGISFAIRLRKPPYFIKKKEGDAYYKYGHSYMVDGKNYYFCMYASIDAAGLITICDELKVTNTVIKIRHGQKKHGRSVSFSQKRWDVASMLRDDDRSIDQRRLIEKNILANILRWWNGREDRWNVVVKKHGERVTFSIDQSLSKDYFADRNVCINSSTGKPMKIVHYVSGHDRVIKGKTIKVNEHIRGLREFDWKGYHCLVTAPKFTGHTSAHASLISEEIPENNDIPKGLVGTSKFGALMAEFEEKDHRKTRDSKTKYLHTTSNHKGNSA